MILHALFSLERLPFILKIIYRVYISSVRFTKGIERPELFIVFPVFVKQPPEYELTDIPISDEIFTDGTLLLSLKKQDGIDLKPAQHSEPDSGFSK